MTLKTFLSTVAIAAITVAVVPTHAAGPSIGAATNRACSFADLTGVSVDGCTGFFSGNMLQGDTGNTVSAIVAAQLGLLGMSSPSSATYLEKIGSLGGGSTVDFTMPLSGTTIVGFHFGQGSNALKGLPAYSGSGGGTAFYRFNAGTNLDTFGLALSASSGAAVFQTSPVPEPETSALMLAGLGALGYVARRRQRV